MVPRPKIVATWVAIAFVAALPAALSRSIDARGADQVVASQQGRPPAPVAPAPRGTATISVTVVAEDGSAIKRARVIAIGIGGAGTGPAAAATAPGQMPMVNVQPSRDAGRTAPVQRQARTGPGGVATITELPAGEYMVVATAPVGFVSQGSPGSQSRVQVQSGGHATATVKLSRAGVVTGRVYDEDGDPVTGAYVSVYRVSKAGGGRMSGGGSGFQPTNDLGVYRVWNLPPGDYMVSTSYEDRQGGPVDESTAVEGYLPTYFPGVVAFDAARPVSVKAGQETGGVDIPLLRGRVGSVTVRVIDSSGSAVGQGGPNASVALTARTRNPAYSTRGYSMRPDGTFVIANVPAGDYYVSATLMRGSPGPTSVREGAYVPVSVNGDEVAVTIQTNAGATVSGRLVVEGAPPAQSTNRGSAARPPAMRVLARPVASEYAYTPAFGSGDSSGGVVRPDGTFTLTGLRGPTQFQAIGARAALKEVRRGAADISGRPLDLAGTEHIDDLVIVMTYDTGGIQGTVVDESDASLSAAAVFVVPSDPEKWHPGSPFMRTARVTAGSAGGMGAAASATPGISTAGQTVGDGTAAFQITLLPPGRYIVIGFADAASAGQPDAEAIERWRGEGKEVTVDAGQTATVKVKAIK